MTGVLHTVPDNDLVLYTQASNDLVLHTSDVPLVSNPFGARVRLITPPGRRHHSGQGNAREERGMDGCCIHPVNLWVLYTTE
jgi:hypothetical protein